MMNQNDVQFHALRAGEAIAGQCTKLADRLFARLAEFVPPAPPDPQLAELIRETRALTDALRAESGTGSHGAGGYEYDLSLLPVHAARVRRSA